MFTVVLDATRTLDDSDIYKPLLYRSMRNEKCFYIKSEEPSKINKIKSIIKCYPKNDYEIIILLDLMQSGESMIEKIYEINKKILLEIFLAVKRATKIRYLVLDYINGNYMAEENEFLKNIEDIQTEESLANYLNKINQSANKITWIDEMVNIEYYNAKELFIERILLKSEIDVITLNKLPNEEKEEFIRNIYLKVYGFINLIAEEVIEEDLTACCYQELPIYNLNIELDEKTIEETSKRYLLNLENEDKKLDLSSYEKIEYTALFDKEDNEIKEYQKVINEIQKMKLQLKTPKVSFFNNKKDLKALDIYVEKAKEEYKHKSRALRNLYGRECRNVRDDLNKNFSDIKLEIKERFEIENKIKEEQAKIEQLKYKKAKLVVENKEEAEEYEECLEKQKIIIENTINKRKITSDSFIFQVLFLLIYFIMIYILLQYQYDDFDVLKINMLKIIGIIISIWIIVLIIVSIFHKLVIKSAYKKINKKLENLFLKKTENQREGTESIQITKKLIKSKKTINHLQELLNKANTEINKVETHKKIIRDHKNFCDIVIKNMTLDGSIDINDLNSTFNIDLDEKESYKNKPYSFMDYILFNTKPMSLKNAKTSRVIKKENAGTYINYVSIE